MPGPNNAARSTLELLRSRDSSQTQEVQSEAPLMQRVRHAASLRGMGKRLGIGLAALFAVSGCADLRDLDAGVCGNGVIESGEDCDGPGSGCGTPETASACRFLCGSELACPDSFQCGSDGVCRFATGRFELANELQSEQDVFSQLADMDGDGIRDLVSMDPSLGIRVSYLDARAAVVTTTQVPTGFARPSVGQLTDSEQLAQQPARFDLVDVGSGAINVLRGRADRTLAPTSYSSIPVLDTVAYVVLDARPPDGDDYFGDEILSFAGTNVRSTTDSVPLFSLPFDVQNLAGSIAHGQLDTRLAPTQEPLSPWEEFLLAESNGTAVYVFSPAKWKSFATKNSAWNDDPGVYPPVKMPAKGRVQSSPFILDLNGDAHLDLVVAGASDDGGPLGGLDLYVAFGRGDGSFHSDKDNLPTTGQPADQTFLQVPTSLPAVPLAIGFLNADTKLDLVLPGAVLISGPGPSDCFQVVPGYSCIKSEDDWNDARIGQFNGTVGLDIIAASSASRRLEFWNNTGSGGFHRFSIPTKNFPSRLTVGDFDGDLLQDVAIVESKYQTYASFGPSIGFGGDPDQRDTVSVLFGRAFGAPEPPAAVGQLGAVQSVVSGRIGASDDFDDLDDLGVLSSYFDEKTGESRSVAVFLGSTNRLLSAPFQLTDGGASTDPDVALRTWLGDFDGDSHDDISALAIDVNRLSNADFVLRNWHLPSTGEAELNEQSAKPGPDTSKDFDYCAALGVPLDLGSDGRSELVFLGRKKESDKKGAGAVTTWRVDGSGSWVSPDPPVELPLLFSAPVLERFPCEVVRAGVSATSSAGGNFNIDEASTGQLFAADVDEQPGQDLVALGFDDGEGKLSAMVLLQRDGGLDTQDPIVLKTPEKLTLLGLLPIQADRDPATELLLLTSQGVELAEIDLGGRTLVVLRRVFETGFFGAPQPLPGNAPDPGPGGDEPLAVGGIGSGFGAYLSAATGDVNGDGLEDFSFVHQGSLRLFLAVDTRRTELP